MNNEMKCQSRGRNEHSTAPEMFKVTTLTKDSESRTVTMCLSHAVESEARGAQCEIILT